MQSAFNIVYHFLMWLSALTGFTYFEINIIVYYIIIPFVYLYFIDKIFKWHYFKIGFALIWLVIILWVDDFSRFSDKLFRLSQQFLLSFEWAGMNYVVASLFFCVLVPLIILLWLIWLNRRRKSAGK